MTLHQLKIFAAAAKHLNMTKASLELHISQSSISQQLKLLEEECEVKLYNKIGRGIELTEKGRLLLIDIEPILHQIKKLKEKYNGYEKNVKSGEVDFKN
jgi:DNA-binding transcriptional LysR family regulator